MMQRVILAAGVVGFCALASVGAAQGVRGAGRGAAEPTFHALQPGVTSEEIKTVRDTRWSYIVYAPKAYTPERKWPVMFIMAPGGGTPGPLKRYIAGAEMNQWLLAISVQSRNSFDGAKQAMMAMVEDVLKHLPVDEQRLYPSGFWGGSRMAAELARSYKGRPPIAGIIACGAGSLGGIPSSTVVYGLSGSNCFNRWDMACDFRAIRNRYSVLRFFVGDHVWAEEGGLALAMTWLNALALSGAAPGNKALLAERDALAESIRANIERTKSLRPESAYDWAGCLALSTPGAPPAAGKELQELLNNATVKLYAEGLKEVDAFVKKHFATNPMDFRNRNGTPAAERDGTRLAEKYKETVLAGLFAAMAKPSAMPGKN